MMIKRIRISTKKIVAMVALPLLASLAPDAAAENATPVNQACGVLTNMGDHTYIYNNSRYDWNVVFITTLIGGDFGRSLNAGAVKYLSGEGQWVDTGIGDYRSAKTYTVPVTAGQTVAIAYCADHSVATHRIDGHVFFAAANPALVHGSPDGNVLFRGENGTPYLFNHGTTPYVDYNRKPTKEFENGSITICPNDPECKIP